MTCAGIASLVVTRGKASQTEQRISNGQVDCCSVTPQQGEIERGMRWLARNIKVGAQASSSAYFYQMYCIERVGRLTGTRFIGTTDWYRMGCEHIVGLQDKLRGTWKGSLSHGESNRLIASSFALLFLGKGRRPLAVSKSSLRRNRTMESASTGFTKPSDANRKAVGHVFDVANHGNRIGQCRRFTGVSRPVY